MTQIYSFVFDPYWERGPILLQQKTQRLLHCISTISQNFRVREKPFSKVSRGLIEPADLPTWEILWLFNHQTFPGVRDDSGSTTFHVQQEPSTQPPGRNNRSYLCGCANCSNLLSDKSRLVVVRHFIHHFSRLLRVQMKTTKPPKTTSARIAIVLFLLFLGQGCGVGTKPCSKPRKISVLVVVD